MVEIPGRQLVEDCPVYYPEAQESAAVAKLRAESPAPGSRLPTPDEALLALLDDPSIASKRWIYEQYDSSVQARAVIHPGGDAGDPPGPGYRLRHRCHHRLQRPVSGARSV